eukprot:607458-Rhodomonas_salina.2
MAKRVHSAILVRFDTRYVSTGQRRASGFAFRVSGVGVNQYLHACTLAAMWNKVKSAKANTDPFPSICTPHPTHTHQETQRHARH